MANRKTQLLIQTLKERHQRELKSLQDAIKNCDDDFFGFIPERINVLKSSDVLDTIIPDASSSRKTIGISIQHYEFKAYEKKFYLSNEYLKAWQSHCATHTVPDDIRSAMIWLFLLHEFLHPSQRITSYRYHHLDNAPNCLQFVDYQADALAILCYFKFLESGMIKPTESFPAKDVWKNRLAEVIKANISVMEVFTQIYHRYPVEMLPTATWLRYLTWHFQYTRALMYLDGTTIDNFALLERPVFDLSFSDNFFDKPHITIGDAHESNLKIFVTHNRQLFDHKGDAKSFSSNLVRGILTPNLELSQISLQELLEKNLVLLGRDNEHSTRPPINPLVTFVKLDGLTKAMEKFVELSKSHSKIEVLVICTDKIGEFLRDQPVDFFIGKQITFLVLADQGNGISEREMEIRSMVSPLVSDVTNIRQAIRQKLADLNDIGTAAALTIKRYDTFPFLEVWFFDDQVAVFGLVQSTCPTKEQTFFLCKNNTALFSWLRRYYNYINKISRLDKASAAPPSNNGVEEGVSNVIPITPR